MNKWMKGENYRWFGAAVLELKVRLMHVTLIIVSREMCSRIEMQIHAGRM